MQLKGAMFAANTHDHTNQLLVDELVRGVRHTGSPSPRHEDSNMYNVDDDDLSSSDDEHKGDGSGPSAHVRRKAKLKTMQCKCCLVR